MFRHESKGYKQTDKTVKIKVLSGFCRLMMHVTGGLISGRFTQLCVEAVKIASRMMFYLMGKQSPVSNNKTNIVKVFTRVGTEVCLLAVGL